MRTVGYISNMLLDGSNAGTWPGDTEVAPAETAMRGREPVYRDGHTFLTGSIWARLNGERVGRLAFEVHEEISQILLCNIDFDNMEHRRRGGGRALLERLEAEYPDQRWWFAADERSLHSVEGIALMRSRRKPGRRWVHTASCTSRLSQKCDCEFEDPQVVDDDYDH